MRNLTTWLQETFGKRQKPARKRPQRPRFIPRVEELEPRFAPSTDLVTTTADSGAGSLRAVISTANPGDTIQFDSSLNGQTIFLTTGDIVLNENLTISGPGASLLTISGNNTSRVFETKFVTTPPTDIISGLTIEDGSTNLGGGVLVGPKTTLNINSSILSGNQASAEGGAIFNYGTLTVNYSTITGNTSILGGGGLYSTTKTGYSATSLSINDSTISGNHSQTAGGGINNNAQLTVKRSTISGNTAQTDGGGVFNQTSANSKLYSCTLAYNTAGMGGALYVSNGAKLSISNSTISGNTATAGGGGVYNNSANTYTSHPQSLQLKSSIVAGNKLGTSGTNPDVSGFVYSNGNNLIGDTTGSNPFSYDISSYSATNNWASSDQFGPPILGSLQNNGGPTQTIAPLPGSLAIGNGSATATATDQRGYVIGTSPDIGAVQSEFGDNFSNSTLDNAWTSPTSSGFQAFTFTDSSSGGNAAHSSTGFGLVVINPTNSDAANVSVDATVQLKSGGAATVDYAGVLGRGTSSGFYFGLLYENNSSGTYLAQLGYFNLTDGSSNVLGAYDFSGSTFNFSAANAPHGNLQLDLYGNNLELVLNGNLLLSASDSTQAGAGSAGMMDAQGGSTFTNFFTYRIGAPPVPFTDTFSGTSGASLGNPWSAIQGGFALNGSNHAQSFAINSSQPLSQATLYGLTANDVSVSASVDVSAATSLAGGVIARAADANNSYYGYLDGSGTLHFGKRVNGTDTDFNTKSVGATSGTVRLDAVGTTLNLYLNGILELTTTDNKFSSGTLGIRSASQGALFSNFSVSAGVVQGSFTVANDQATAGSSEAIGSVNSSLTNVNESATIFNIGSTGVGLLAQWNSATNTGYQALVLPTGTVEIVYVVGGTVSATVATTTLTLPTAPFTLNFVVSGSSMTVLINGKQVLTGTSADPLGSGEAGIISVGGGSIFTNLFASGS